MANEGLSKEEHGLALFFAKAFGSFLVQEKCHCSIPFHAVQCDVGRKCCTGR